MNEVVQGRRMPVREVAAVLGVTEEAIKKHIRELYPDLMRNGVATCLSEAQIAEIKRKMLPTTEVVGSMTDIEAGIMAVRVMEHFKARYEQERVLRIEAENRLAIAGPKAEALDAISAGKGDVTVKKLAAVLALPRVSEKALLLRLREDGYLNKDGSPARQCIDRGLLYEKFTGNPAKPRLMISPKGLVHFSVKYAAGRCKASGADELLPCTGYRLGKHGGAWLQSIEDGSKNKRLSYSREQGGAPALCRACVKIIGKTVPGFHPRNYIFLRLPEAASPGLRAGA
jgi:phage antirepressor YoqD-like protein